MTGLSIGRHLAAACLATTLLTVSGAALARQPSQAARIAQLERQLDELRAQVEALKAARVAPAPLAAALPAVAPSPAPTPPVVLAAAPPAPPAVPKPKKAWYEKLQVRGYVQMRVNEQISGARTAPAGVARLRSIHDAAVGEPGNFSLRRARLVVQGDVSDRLSVYLQGDLAASVANQSNGERRDHFLQMRDAYADLHLANHRLKLRFGQSKVPFGWENLQSSSNRIAIDRADGPNSAVPGERDLGVVAYYTPASVQKIWDELNADGQKTFGNYGAIGLGVFNGQGINRPEKNDGLMKVAMVSWPFRLDGLGPAFEGQVLEVGAQGMLNSVQPEVRTGGVSATAFRDDRVNLHAILYPAPFGFQAEWTWGKGPQWDAARGAIVGKRLSGGYVQAMVRVKSTPVGAIMPYARWQTFTGGWKASTNAPRFDTREWELGAEWQPLKELELTVAYANMKRTEPDERRTGQAAGELIRAQIQWNY